MFSWKEHMARIDDLLDFDAAPAVAEVDGTDYSLAAASDSFADALFDTELEEQRGKHQRGHHQEEAEVDEVLAEVRRAA